MAQGRDHVNKRRPRLVRETHGGLFVGNDDDLPVISETVRPFEPANRWFIPVETYWNLHDGHASAPWAEELAWTAARVWIPSDECYEPCVLDRIARSHARYWWHYPQGRHVREALAEASRLSTYAAGLGCVERQPPIAALIARLRESLAPVTDPAREQLLQDLAAIERAC